MMNGEENDSNDGQVSEEGTEDEIPEPAQETEIQQSIRERAERREARGSAKAPGTPSTPLHTLASVRKALERGTASVRKVKVSDEDDADRVPPPPPPPATKTSTRDAAAPAFGLRGGAHLPVGTQEELEEALRAQRVRMGKKGKEASPSPRPVERSRLVFGEAAARGRSELPTSPPKLPTPPASTSPRAKERTSDMPDNGQWEQIMLAMKAMASRVDSMAGAQEQLVEHVVSLDTAFVALEKKKKKKDKEATEAVDLDGSDHTADPARDGAPVGIGSGVFASEEEEDYRKLKEYQEAILNRSLHAPNSSGENPSPTERFGIRDPPSPYVPMVVSTEDAEEWAERQTSRLRAEYDLAPDDLAREAIMFKMVMLRPQGALAQASGATRKDAKNHVSTEKLKKADDFRGAVHKRMLLERMWYETDVREYLTHASPDGGLPLYHAIQDLAAPLALAYSQATTAEERVDIIARLDLIPVPKGLDNEMVTRFPAVLARALNKDALQFHTEYLQVTLNSHERGPMATLVAWRFASLCGNGPRSPEDWLSMTNFVEKPSRVLRDADSTTVLLAWREWLNLAKETIALGLTSAARIAPGMKTAFLEFMAFIGPERSHRLRMEGFYAAGLDSRGTSWGRLEEVYGVMYRVCGYLDDEPELRRHLRKSSRANAGRQVSPSQGAHAGDHKDKRPHTPPVRRRKGKHPSRSPSASSASRSRASRSASPASGTTGKVKLDDKAKVIKDAAAAEVTERKRAKSKLRRANAAIKKAAVAAAAAATHGRKTPPSRSRSPAARAAQNGGNEAKGECFLYKAEGKCRFGDRCRFSHEKKGHAAHDASRSKSPGRGETNPASRPCYNCGKTGHMVAECKEVKKAGSPCFYFRIRGECRYGDLCKYSHDKVKANAAKTPAAKEGKKSDFP